MLVVELFILIAELT